MHETEVTAKIVHELRYAHKLFVVNLHGGQYGYAGMPDILILCEGEDIYVEAKKSGENLDPLQVRVAKQMRAQGADVFKLEYRSKNEWVVDDLYSIKFRYFRDGVQMLLETLLKLCRKGMVA